MQRKFKYFGFSLLGAAYFLAAEFTAADVVPVCGSCSETTIQGAFSNHDLEPGDVIEIQDDRTYTGVIYWGRNDGGSSAGRVVLRAQAGRQPVIQGYIHVWPEVDYVQIGGEAGDGRITIDPTETSWIDGAISLYGSHSVIQYMNIRDVYDGNGIFLWGGGTDNIIQYNTIADIGTSRFVFPGSQGDGIIVYVNQANAQHIIRGNTLRNIAHTGILTYSGCSHIRILDNVVDNSYGNGIGAQASSFVLIEGNLIYGTGTALNWTNKRSLQLTGSDHCSIRRNIVYNSYNEAMEAFSYRSGQVQDHILIYNNVFHTTGWAGIGLGSWVSEGYTANTPVVNNIFYNIGVRGDQMVHPSRNAVTNLYGGGCAAGDDLGDSDAELQSSNLKGSPFQNNLFVPSSANSMPAYALQYLNCGGSYSWAKTVAELNQFDDSTTGNITAEPLFAGAPPADKWWNVHGNSPCIDAGIVVNDVNAAEGGWEQLSYYGQAPDIGAHEYQTDAIAPGAPANLRTSAAN
jgi:hypothetical protein